MNFDLTDEQRALIEVTRELLERHSSVAAARALIDGPSGYDEQLWRKGVGLGWPALTIAEEHGGLGLQSTELALVAVELGRGLASTPFLPTAVVADAVTRSTAVDRVALLSSLASGTQTAAWAFAEAGQPWSTAGIHTTAVRDGSGYVINGAKASVQDADSAAVLLVDAVLDGRPARFLVPADTTGVKIERQHTLDVTRRYCDVVLDGAVLGATALCAEGAAAEQSIVRSNELAAVLTCAELVGVGERLLELTVAYVKDRVQFGKAVGSFQAVKHKCADMRIWIQSSAAATYFAAMTLDSQHHDSAHAASVAKAYVSDAVNQLAGEALQLHGGIGFTWEHDLHLFLRRARVGAALYGDADHHREELFLAQVLASA
ncbi:acyl-CoA dehydrogenase family protein [Mycolicibacterium holsaticum]|uniref:acyl-CoA dehydrogenase family protein n=1 Tax=Mycolicibacterium holsaticum TaxID=152142 RepID=UPI001C7D488B|nr:acyl-CoA dehydrogenase family protein [Mycolicibacterium holsaticum]MDA4108150.1 acyl-CoA dehydrogenase [Mycolicibacterium holsaticum DSM 44478 = JCM 12374]QZA14440.1 acyl-CoA dehydrogenase family protein [Mycolicibacterium holsaticum DSM 44478 = JCM 12374]UNC08110.1 acyl-CoA dehydrogenase family protein [Mycolicibacterium holsaticum DSM 44478 = JCM 12374]